MSRCPGRVLNYGLVYPIIEKKEHNHEPVPEEECIEAYNKAKHLATETSDKSREICNKINLPIDSSSAFYMQRNQKLSQMITRLRRRKRNQPKDVSSRTEIEYEVHR